ncbi:MAG TPA: BsuPI-related putative proteinase inhibitor [Candidatus Acidoferrum sp.]|nr:BsuPI-related putative proteinase inhibitor [Candidatus Acidoferrum sp.]
MKTGKIIALLLAALMLAAVPLSVMAQSDLKDGYTDIAGKWFEEAARQYGYAEIFSDGSGKFSPDSKITRMEFARLLHKALSIHINYFAAPDIADSFDDMTNADAGAGELIDLVTTGIVEAGGAFEPAAPLTRETMVHWVMRAFEYKTGGEYAIPYIYPMPFDDDADITEAYKSEIRTAVVLRFIGGRGGNMLFPKDGATRAEAVTVVSRLMAALENFAKGVEVNAAARLDENGALTMSLTLRNHTEKPVVIHHTSGQKYDFQLFDAEGKNLYTWSADKMFIMALTVTELAPGEELVFSDALDSEAFPAVKEAVSMRAYLTGTSDDFAVDRTGYAAQIGK